MSDLSPGEVLTALQSKLDDMNDRWNSLNARAVDVGDKLDGEFLFVLIALHSCGRLTSILVQRLVLKT